MERLSFLNDVAASGMSAGDWEGRPRMWRTMRLLKICQGGTKERGADELRWW